MATLYSPVVGLVAILEKVAEGATTCVKVSSGEEARQISDDVLRLQTGCEILEGLLLAIDRSRVSDIPDDLGTSIALSVGDTRLIVDLVKSATERYILHQEQNDFSQMVEGAMTMKDIPKIAVSTCQNLAPFINACKKELGEKSLSDLQSND